MPFRIIIISILFFSVSIAACYREPVFPDAALSNDKMTDILADVHLAEAKVAGMKTISQEQRDSIMDLYYITIFKIHKVKAEDFDQSMDAYMKNPAELSKIYEKVLEKLQKEQSSN